jgi:hypothetical protein
MLWGELKDMLERHGLSDTDDIRIANDRIYWQDKAGGWHSAPVPKDGSTGSTGRVESTSMAELERLWRARSSTDPSAAAARAIAP